MADCKLTPEITEIICQHIEKGNSYETACQAVGICRSTLHNWLNRAEKNESDFVQFAQQIKKARAKSEIRHVEVIDKAMDKNWQAAAWWLERANPHSWGNRQEQHIEHTGKIDSNIIFKFETVKNDNNSTTSTPTQTTTSNGSTTK